MQKNYKIALIVGGWYYPKHLYSILNELVIPPNIQLDKFVVSHRLPTNAILNEIDSLRSSSKSKNEELIGLDNILFSEIADHDFLKSNFNFIEAENIAGDYHFVNQWMETNDYNDYDYIIFMHDDNFLSPEFKNILVDVFQMPEIRMFSYGWKLKMWIPESVKNQQFDYIANSAVGHRATARGSFSIWSRNLINLIGGSFSLKDVSLDRSGKTDTPIGHMELEDWNLIGRNLQYAVQAAKLMPTTFRLSKYYRASKYMLEGERGIISNNNVTINQNPYYDGFEYFKKYYILNRSESQ